MLVRRASFRGVALKRIRPAEPEMGKRLLGLILDDAAMVDHPLKLRGRFPSLMRGEVRLPTQVDGHRLERIGQIVGSRDAQTLNRLLGIASSERERRFGLGYKAVQNRGRIGELSLQSIGQFPRARRIPTQRYD